MLGLKIFVWVQTFRRGPPCPRATSATLIQTLSLLISNFEPVLYQSEWFLFNWPPHPPLFRTKMKKGIVSDVWEKKCFHGRQGFLVFWDWGRKLYIFSILSARSLVSSLLQDSCQKASAQRLSCWWWLWWWGARCMVTMMTKKAQKEYFLNPRSRKS